MAGRALCAIGPSHYLAILVPPSLTEVLILPIETAPDQFWGDSVTRHRRRFFSSRSCGARAARSIPVPSDESAKRCQTKPVLTLSQESSLDTVVPVPVPVAPTEELVV